MIETLTPNLTGETLYKKVREDFIYDSGSNEDWMTSEELLNWLEKNKDKIGKI